MSRLGTYESLTSCFPATVWTMKVESGRVAKCIYKGHAPKGIVLLPSSSSILSHNHLRSNTYKQTQLESIFSIHKRPSPTVPDFPRSNPTLQGPFLRRCTLVVVAAEEGIEVATLEAAPEAAPAAGLNMGACLELVSKAAAGAATAMV